MVRFDPDKEPIGKVIHKLIIFSGLDNEMLCERAGFSKEYLQEIMSGEVPLSIPVVIKLKEGLSAGTMFFWLNLGRNCSDTKACLDLLVLETQMIFYFSPFLLQYVKKGLKEGYSIIEMYDRCGLDPP
ncbi:MAG: hypothetical protein PHW52_02645 [Candidatus Pacebacteria bacterium]|nr:hypothetical protein [Candidatus Paceibacterota bacterium]